MVLMMSWVMMNIYGTLTSDGSAQKSLPAGLLSQTMLVPKPRNASQSPSTTLV